MKCTTHMETNECKYNLLRSTTMIQLYLLIQWHLSIQSVFVNVPDRIDLYQRIEYNSLWYNCIPDTFINQIHNYRSYLQFNCICLSFLSHVSLVSHLLQVAIFFFTQINCISWYNYISDIQINCISLLSRPILVHFSPPFSNIACSLFLITYNYES